jgi:hypothetical protein
MDSKNANTGYLLIFDFRKEEYRESKNLQRNQDGLILKADAFLKLSLSRIFEYSAG